MLTDQAQLWILVVSGVILLAAILLAVYRRRRRSVEMAEEVDPAFSALRASHEPFYRIMYAFQQRHDLAEILAEPDVRDAYKLLQLRRDGSAARAGSPLQLHDASREIDEGQLRAAMLTIVRAIYMDQRLAADLGPELQGELDRLLEGI